MSQTSPRLLAGLFTTSAILSVALTWSGWRLLEQQRDLDTRLAHDQAEAAATAMASGIRERLADLGDQLGARLSSTASDRTGSTPGLVLVVTRRAAQVEVEPAGALPFLPEMLPPVPASPLLAEGEAAEFSSDGPLAALQIYARLARHADPSVRAGAVLRVGRVLRKLGRTDEAISAYKRLATLGNVSTDSLGVPAALLALDGQRLTYRQLRDAANEQRLADELRRRLDAGEWRVSRGMAEFYRDEVSAEPRTERWQLAAAISDAWPANVTARLPRGYSVHTPDHRSLLVVWRTDGVNVAMGAAWLEALVESAGDSKTTWQLADADDRPLAGARIDPQRAAISRVIATGGPTWTLRVWPAATAASATRRGPVLLSVLTAMLAFLWGATYLMARAIRREAAVARLQSDFVAAVSHEFRSPLSTMRQMTEMLDADRVPGETRRRQYYGVLVAETARLQRLVETLLNFGRLEAGGKPYRLADLEIGDLIASVVADIRTEPGHSGRNIVTAFDAVPLHVHGDADAMRMAVRNLVDNAIKYSPVASSVRVSVTADDDRVAIAVSDEGSGIAPDEQRAIFRRFVRGRAAREGRVPGTGVGLAIVQRIVSAHDGAIRLTSEPGRGSTFTLLLPAASVDAAGNPAILQSRHSPLEHQS